MIIKHIYLFIIKLSSKIEIKESTEILKQLNNLKII